MTGPTIYEANRVTASKAKRDTRKSQLPTPDNTNARPPLTYPRYQRTLRAPICLVGHLRTQCASNPTASTSSPTLVPAANPEPTATPVTADYTGAVLSTSITATTRSAPTHASATVISSINTTQPRIPRTDRTTSHHLLPSTPVSHLQRHGLGPYQSSSRSHIHLTYRSAQSVANPSHGDQCLEHSHTIAASAPTALTTSIHPPTAWAYLTKYAFMSSCGRQPPATQPHHTFPHQHLHLTTPSPITSTQLPPATEVGSVLLGSFFMRLPCCVCDSSPRLSRRINHRALEGY
nr:unnamed protein product [Spirometra erinaceieuropaei]